MLSSIAFVIIIIAHFGLGMKISFVELAYFHQTKIAKWLDYYV